MAPAKRARPSFSPPRPNKSKSKSKSDHVSTSLTARGASRKTQKNAALARKQSVGQSKTSGRNARRIQIHDEEDDDEASEEERGPRGRSALALVDASASDTEDEAADQDQDDNENDSDTSHPHRTDLDDSPEPDLLLAEITHETNSASPIPEQLVHKILHAHFEQPEKTRIKSDARVLVTQYLEVFVREAIARCVFERREREDGDEGVSGAFLEVEDLERVGVQLCLDF